jgi:hypothetical protein
MKLYQTPGGTWGTSEADWKKAMKAEGLDPKTYEGRKTVDVPTQQKPLMEFLTFHNVNVVNPQVGTPPATEVVGEAPPPPSPRVASSAAPSTSTVSLDELFSAAPLRAQLDLAVEAIDRANDVIGRVLPADPRTAQ